VTVLVTYQEPVNVLMELIIANIPVTIQWTIGDLIRTDVVVIVSIQESLMIMMSMMEYVIAEFLANLDGSGSKT